MELNQFINSVDNEVTIHGSLPLSIPKAAIMQIIKDAKKWFYRNYDDSTEEGYFYIEINDTAFQCDNYLQLPSSVDAIYGVHVVNGRGNLNDISLERMSLEDYYSNSGGASSVDYYAMKSSQLDMLNFLFGKRVSFDYNPLTHKLFIRGWRPTEGGLICDTFFKIPDEDLFEDGYFFRYVTAKAKITAARLMGTITMQLVGGASIDFGMIKEEGETDLSELIEEIKNQKDVAFILKGH